MEHDDIAPLFLSIVTQTALTFALGIVLVPVWSPEVIPVLAGGAIVLTVVAQILAIRNALRRGEYVWIAIILLTGPVGVLIYSLLKVTESGILTSYLEELSRQTVGEKGQE